MDEIPVWNNIISETTIEQAGKRANGACPVFVCLTANTGETKCKLFLVFKSAKEEEFRTKAIIAIPKNIWVTEELTID